MRLVPFAESAIQAGDVFESHHGNNYAGINISNLDVFLHSLLKYAPQARVIVMVEKSERQYVDKLAELFWLEAILVQPVSEAQMRDELEKLAI